MGQAAVELPEPTDPPTAPPQASADDLLSKLAGDEIDRMLAEVDSTAPAEAEAPTAAAQAVTVSRAPEAPATAVPPAPSGVGADAEVQQQLDALFDELSAPTAASGGAQADIDSITHDEKTTQAAPATAEVGVNSGPQDQVEDLSHELSNEGSPASGGGSTLEAADAAGMPLIAASEPAGSGDSLDAQLVQSLGQAAEPAAPRAPAAQSHSSGGEPEVVTSPTPAGVPWYVKPLELLNAPFASMKPEMRELLGKVAIVTAFNAVVIFVYVLVIRGR